MTEHDVGELREFRAGLADPDAGRMARIRAKVSGGGSPHRARRGVLVPVAVAASVLAVGVGATAVAIDRSGGGSSVGSSPATGSGPATVAEPTKSSSVPDPPAPGAHAAAVQLLEGFAAKAGTGPAALTVPAGKLLYVRTAEGPANVHEMWVDVNGGMPVMIRRTENGKVTLLVPDASNPKSDNTAELAARRADLERLGPDLTRPTPEFLAGLPTDPTAMLGLLRTSSGDSSPWSPDHAITGLVRELLHVNQPLITPQGHAAIYRSLAELDSIASTGQPIDIGGRSLYAISQSERGQTEELLFDPALGIVVGSRDLDVALGVIYSTTWSYGVVDAAGETS